MRLIYLELDGQSITLYWLIKCYDWQGREFGNPEVALGVRMYSLRRLRWMNSSSYFQSAKTGWFGTLWIRGRSIIPLTREVSDCAGVISGSPFVCAGWDALTSFALREYFHGREPSAFTFNQIVFSILSFAPLSHRASEEVDLHIVATVGHWQQVFEVRRSRCPK